jgi:hypothetical protein
MEPLTQLTHMLVQEDLPQERAQVVVQLLRDNEINSVGDFRDLNDNALKELGITAMGMRMKILRAVKKLVCEFVFSYV